MPQLVVSVERELREALQRSNLVVLYDEWLRAAAVDLQSKISEAGLGSVQLADYRSFAHGRHTGLSLHAKSSAILALFCEQNQRLASSTLNLIPKSIPRYGVGLGPAGPVAGLREIATAIHLIANRAQEFGTDPGRPHVPQFGRKLYHLSFRRRDPNPDRLHAAIDRKAMLCVSDERETRSIWNDLGKKALQRLTTVNFHGVVLDYDGTLCAPRFRFRPLPQDIGRELDRLLGQGALVGIATGRGKSVRKALRESINPKLWQKVILLPGVVGLQALRLIDRYMLSHKC